MLSLAIREDIDSAEVIGWWMGAFEELHAVLRTSHVSRTGPDGALFSADFFEQGKGEVVAFVPAEGLVSAEGGVPRSRRVISYEVPAAEVAVATHRGPFSDLDRTYGALGTWVAERSMGVETVRQYLRAGLIDELHFALSPVVLGQGEAMFAGIDLPALGLRVTEHQASEHAMHIVLAR